MLNALLKQVAGPTHVQEERIVKGNEYQESGVLSSHPRICPPQLHSSHAEALPHGGRVDHKLLSYIILGQVAILEKVEQLVSSASINVPGTYQQGFLAEHVRNQFWQT